MEQAANPYALVGELVVELDRCLGLLHMHLDASGLQMVERLFSGLELQLLAPAEHDYSACVLEEFLDIGRLDPRIVAGPGLIPIPFPPAARIKLEIAPRPKFLHVHPPPRHVRDSR